MPAAKKPAVVSTPDIETNNVPAEAPADAVEQAMEDIGATKTDLPSAQKQCVMSNPTALSNGVYEPSPEPHGVHAAMSKVMREMGHISKDRKNPQGYNFRGIDDIYNALHGIMGANDLYMTAEVISHSYSDKPTQRGVQRVCSVHMRYWFNYKDGSRVSTEGAGESFDSSDKSAGKAFSYAQKVALIQTFLIETDEQNDPDYYDNQLVSEPQPQAQQQKQEKVAQPSHKGPVTNETKNDYLSVVKEARELGLNYEDDFAALGEPTEGAVKDWIVSVRADMNKKKREGAKAQEETPAAEPTPAKKQSRTRPAVQGIMIAAGEMGLPNKPEHRKIRNAAVSKWLRDNALLMEADDIPTLNSLEDSTLDRVKAAIRKGELSWGVDDEDGGDEE